MSQIEVFAPGVPLDAVIRIVSVNLVHEIHLVGIKPDNPLHNLSVQLNSDSSAETEARIEAKSDAVLEKLELLDSKLTRNETAGFDALVAQIFDLLGKIHSDYLVSFVKAEKMIRDGVTTRELYSFLGERRIELAASRSHARNHARTLGNQKISGADQATVKFADAVRGYFESSSQPAMITYYTRFLIAVRDTLDRAESAGAQGPQKTEMWRTSTVDRGSYLDGMLQNMTRDLEWRFEDVSEAYSEFVIARA